MDNLQHPNNALQSIHTHSKKALQFVWKCVCIFFNAMYSNSIFFLSPILEVIALKSHFSEVFLLMEPKKLVPLSKVPLIQGPI